MKTTNSFPHERPTDNDRTSSQLSPTLQHLGELLLLYHQRQFTGRLDIEIVTGEQWHLYLSLGRFVWAAGGEHPTRRWQRQLLLAETTIPTQSFVPRAKTQFECWDYHLLSFSANQKLTTTENAIAVIGGIVAEVLFDIFQAIESAVLTQAALHALAVDPEEIFTVKPRIGLRPSTSDTGILPSIWTVEVSSIWGQTQKLWRLWCDLGLTNYSPNLAPIITQPEAMQQRMTPECYQRWATLVTGKRTLRDLAVLMRCKLLAAARSLLRELQQNTIELVEIPDLAPPPFVRPPSAASASQGLIACIDDNPETGDRLQEILKPWGYQTSSIQNAIQAMPKLLERTPDCIFLNLMMPIANGYEICAQIRRVRALQETPVIILIDRDSFIDRLRAKVAGATEFLRKPLDPEKVRQIVQKYHRKKSLRKSQQFQQSGLD